MMKPDCKTCGGTGFVEMGYVRKLDIMWNELCPQCFPEIKESQRQHPLHKTMRLGDGIEDDKPDGGLPVS